MTAPAIIHTLADIEAIEAVPLAERLDGIDNSYVDLRHAAGAVNPSSLRYAICGAAPHGARERRGPGRGADPRRVAERRPGSCDDAERLITDSPGRLAIKLDME